MTSVFVSHPHALGFWEDLARRARKFLMRAWEAWAYAADVLMDLLVGPFDEMGSFHLLNVFESESDKPDKLDILAAFCRVLVGWRATINLTPRDCVERVRLQGGYGVGPWKPFCAPINGGGPKGNAMLINALVLNGTNGALTLSDNRNDQSEQVGRRVCQATGLSKGR